MIIAVNVIALKVNGENHTESKLVLIFIFYNLNLYMSTRSILHRKLTGLATRFKCAFCKLILVKNSQRFILQLRCASLGNFGSFTLSLPIANKPGTALVGAISKAQKDSKTTFSTTGDNKSSQKTKN